MLTIRISQMSRNDDDNAAVHGQDQDHRCHQDYDRLIRTTRTY